MQKFVSPEPDPSSKNCKYKSVSYSNELAVYTRYVANELAEANRLKRIELKILSGHFKLNNLNELEDRA